MSVEARQLHLLGATSQYRTDTFDGREHLVVPVVALIGDNVIHAVNAETPEFVPYASLAASPSSWDGRPLMLGHPTQNGRQISANDPKVMDRQGFGFMAASRLNGKRLGTEAWIDPVKLDKIGGAKLLERIKNNDPIEVSVGAFVTTNDRSGFHNGKPYKAEWATIAPDHLAFLPDSRGACSLSMGCGSGRLAEMVTAEGFRAATEADFDALGVKELEHMADEKRSLRERVKALIGVKALDTHSEAAELIAYKTMQTLLEQVGSLYDDTSATIDDLISDEEEHPAITSADEDVETEIEAARCESIQMFCYSMSALLNQIVSLTFKQLAPGLPASSDPRYAEEIRTAIGKSISAANLKTIQAAHDASHATHDSTLALGAECSNGMKLLEATADKIDTTVVKTGTDTIDMVDKTVTADKPCGCGGRSAEEKSDMTKTERIKALLGHKDGGFTVADEPMLNAMTDTRLEALEVQVNGGVRTAATKADAEKTVADKAAADKVAADHAKLLADKKAADDALALEEAQGKGKQKAAEAKLKAAQAAGKSLAEFEEDEFLATAPESIRTLVAEKKVADAQVKTNLVSRLKTAAEGIYTDKELDAMSNDTLARMLKLAKIDEPTVDFSGRGMVQHRAAGEVDPRSNPPDGYAIALAKQRGEKVAVN